MPLNLLPRRRSNNIISHTPEHYKPQADDTPLYSADASDNDDGDGALEDIELDEPEPKPKAAEETQSRQHQQQQQQRSRSRDKRRLCSLTDVAFKMVAVSVVVALVVSLVTVEVLGDASQVITNDTYFYGLSDPVYPSPKAKGTGTWAEAFSKARKLVGRMTLEEKNALTHGVVSFRNGCDGHIPAVESVGFPGMCLKDAGNGIRGADFVNAYPSGLHVGAAWNKDLAHSRAEEMGLEFRRKGVNIALAPVVGPIGRVATGGRNWEGFAADPYLSGALAAETVRGMQGVGVVTSIKHFIGNEQELWRKPGPDGGGRHVEALSSNIDDKTMHELYLWPFQDAVRAGGACVMCSYQRVNNSYGCQNSKILNGLLKTELGFEGFVVTDWDAQHAGYASALAGLDMIMPTTTLWGKKLIEAVHNGSVPESRINDMATRIIAAWYQMGQDSPDFETPGFGIPVVFGKKHAVVDAKSPSSKPVLLNGAMEGHVLVKNVNNTLPLRKPKLLSLFGYDGRVNSLIDPVFLENTPPVNQQYAPFNLWNGGGSGANAPAYLSDPYSAFSQRAYEDDTSILWDFVSSAPYVNSASDACFVFINAFANEGYDRPGLEDDHSDRIVENVAKSCPNTIVVVHNAGARTVGSWIDNPNVKAVVFAHLPGQDSGRALVKLVYGEESFSGKLPYTVARQEKQYGHLLYHDKPEGKYVLFPQSDFTEGVDIDYRHFEKKKVTPRFEFGFGMTYTTFEFSALTVNMDYSASLAEYPPRGAPIRSGGNPRLWDVLATVTAVLTNTGQNEAQQVAQLYLQAPATVAKVSRRETKKLRGFEKVRLAPGQSITVTFELTRRDLSVWDAKAQMWRLSEGRYDVFVGESSRLLPLKGGFTI